VRPLRRTAALAVAVGLLTVAGCSDLQGTEGKEWITGEGRIIEVAPAERAAPVKASGEDLDGNALDLDDYRDRVVVLNVYASWCPPCRAEMPLVGELADSYDPTEVAFLGVNIRDASRDNAEAFIRGQDVDFPSFYDPGSEVLLRLSDELGPYTLPSTVVLDRRGRLAVLVIGQIPGAVSMSDAIDQVLAETDG
jgi:thiol-disulfide isomerase/thioredoxin